jgi:uncharacterized protein (DUF1499 family)
MIKRVQLFLVSLFLLTGCTGKTPELGVHNGLLMECPDSPNCVNSQAKDDEHAIQAIVFKGTSKEAESRILESLGELKGTKVVVVENNYIRAEFVSAVFRFTDDVEFYFPESGEKETTIHVRSASRVGRSDFGVNRKRIEQLRRLLE